MIKGHGGNIYDMAHRLGCPPADIVDMSSNLNPLGPPGNLIAYLTARIDRIHALPEADAGASVVAFAERYGILPENVLAGNGTTQFIYSLPQALGTNKALIVGPTYADYADACSVHRVPLEYVFSKESFNFEPKLAEIKDRLHGIDTVFICNPNNPTGVLIAVDKLIELVQRYPDVRWIVDESYLPFADTDGRHSLITYNLPNVIVLSSLSKIFQIPGLRIGFLVSHVNLLRKVARYALPWSVNSLSQVAVKYLMHHRAEIDTFIKETRNFLNTERNTFHTALNHVSHIKLFPSTTSFLLAKLSGNHTSDSVCDFFEKNRILIRNCSNFMGLSDRFIRVSLKTHHVNRNAIQRFLSLFEG